MKMIILTILTSALVLTGCGSAPTKPDVVVKYEYIVRKAPDELFVIPPTAVIDSINLETATQANIAEWILKSEGRTQELERKLQELKKLQNAPIVDQK